MLRRYPNLRSESAGRSLRVAAALLAPLLALSAGQLDPRLKLLKQQWLKNAPQVLARIVAGETVVAPASALSVRNDMPRVQATISLASTKVLEDLHVPFTRVTPTVVTADLPLSALEALERAPSVHRVECSYQMETHNDKNMTKLHVSVPHQAGYTGSAVLVGVIDTGLDVAHPAFRVGGTATGASRVQYLWDQTISHTPFTVGSFSSTKGRRWTAAEITGGTCTEVDEGGHGTHVTGSVAGYDASFTNNMGAAKNANILFVKTTFNSSDILNGIVWLNEQAKALGKPIVVNLSLGSSYGPHDGTDANTKAVDDLVAASNGNLIVVRSAGNYANDGVHGSATLTPAGISLPVIVETYTQSSSRADAMRFMFYYDATAKVSIRVKDTAGNASAWMTPSTSAYQGYLQDGAGYYLDIASAAEANNPAIKSAFVYLGELESNNDGHHVIPGTYTLEFKTEAGSTRLDGWLYSNANGEVPSYFQIADANMTLGNDACGSNVITVAAYTSRRTWPASDGKNYSYTNETQDAIATFSSIGPTRDNRQKPDITAGGAMVLSARSSAAPSPGAVYLPSTGTDFYTYMQGTSMSSPITSGAVALLKERNPSWTHANVLAYLKANAQGTTVLTTPGIWNKNWGWGVVDLLNMDQSVGVTVSPSGTVQATVGGTVSFKATVTGSTNHSVNWTVSNNGGTIAPATTAGDGIATTIYTAPATPGTYTVTATSAVDPTRSASTTVQVMSAPVITVTVSPATKTLLTGGTFTFTATIAGTATPGTVAWSTTGGTITSAGAYTAPTTAGTYTVTATANGVSGSATVDVKTLDLNGDGVVDTLDVLQLTRRWASTSTDDLAKADLNGDGVINEADLDLLQNAL